MAFMVSKLANQNDFSVVWLSVDHPPKKPRTKFNN